jgi:hypothetical protein
MNFGSNSLVKKLHHILIVFTVVFTVASCGGKKLTADGIKLKNHNWKELVDSLKNNEFKYEWIRSKASSKVVFKGDDNTVKANLRIRKDSASWVNLSKGIQIMTAVTSHDSIKVLKKIGDKEYYIDDFNTVNRFLNTEVDYSLLEDFFAGNAIGFDYDSVKYKSGIEDGLYVLSSDKIKKLDKMIKRGYNKHKEILYRCWINPENFKCQKVRVDLLLDSASLTVEYGDWRNIDGGEVFPFSSSISLKTLNDTVQLALEYSKIIINEPQTMPFKLTDSYQPMIIK